MRVAVFADVHYDNYPSLTRSEVGLLSSRAEEISKVVNWIRQECQSRGISPEMIWCLGDIFHKRNLIEVPVFNRAYEDMRRFGGLNLVVGNHDQTTKGGLDHSIKPFIDTCNIWSNIELVELGGGYDSLVLPYRETYPVDLFKKIDPSRVLIFGHCGIEGGRFSGFEIRGKGEITQAQLRLAEVAGGFFGHYHVHQHLSTKAWYVGAPLQHSFRDAGQRCGFMIANFDGGKLETEFIENTFSPKFHIVDMTADSPDNYPDTDFIRLKNATPSQMKQYTDKSNVFGVEKEAEQGEIRLSLSLTEDYESLVDKWVDYQCTDPRRRRQLKSIGKDIFRRLNEN